jgi:hypothetical protein
MLQSCQIMKTQTKYWTFVISILFSFLFLAGTGIKLASANTQTESANSLNQTETLWAPYLEWSLNNPGWSGNPFDVIAIVTFVHGSGETRQTEMFYAGGTTWKFRFTGTQTGQWSFTTSSSASDLNGHSGNITINPNPNSDIKGFLINSGNKFAPTLPAPSPSPTIAPPFPPVPGPVPIIINFQPETAPLMEGQEPDFGEVFGQRMNGLFYGWNQDNRENARFRQEPASPDLAHDTLNHLEKDGHYSWEIELVNGEYYVIVVGGDPSYLDSVIKIEVDGVLIADGIPSVDNPWVSGSGFVDITDGRLTITSGEDALNNKINYIVITGLGFADDPLRYTLHLPIVSRR